MRRPRRLSPKRGLLLGSLGMSLLFSCPSLRPLPHPFPTLPFPLSSLPFTLSTP